MKMKNFKLLIYYLTIKYLDLFIYMLLFIIIIGYYMSNNVIYYIQQDPYLTMFQKRQEIRPLIKYKNELREDLDSAMDVYSRIS